MTRPESAGGPAPALEGLPRTRAAHLVGVPPAAGWGKAWAGALVIVLACGLGLEAFWRAHGHAPSVVDDKDLWSYWREKVSDGNANSVALLGASRGQLGFVPDVFKSAFPGYNVAQLAVDGENFVATLDDLAADPDFRGIALCDVRDASLLPEGREGQMAYVAYYHSDWRLNKKVNRSLLTFVQSHFAFVNPRLDLREILRAVRTRTPPAPFYLVTHPDRSRSADYSKTDVAEQVAIRVRNQENDYAKLAPVTPEQWLEDVARIQASVEKIQQRGGQVVFIRYPTSGQFRSTEDLRFPRSQFWDVFAAHITAPAIHFEDVPALSGFECPDDSHLDMKDAPAFTLALAAELERRGIIHR